MPSFSSLGAWWGIKVILSARFISYLLLFVEYYFDLCGLENLGIQF